MTSHPKEQHMLSVRELLATIKREEQEPNPHHLAKLVLDAIPDDQLRDALAQTLPDYVRININGYAHIDHILVPESEPSYKGQQPTNTPRKYRNMVDARERKLTMSVCVDDDPRAPLYKLLRDCTAADLLAAGNRRIENGRASIHRGELFVEFADKMQMQGVTVVGEMPIEEIDGFQI